MLYIVVYFYKYFLISLLMRCISMFKMKIFFSINFKAKSENSIFVLNETKNYVINYRRKGFRKVYNGG